METKTVAWFCLRAQTKHEHIAAAHLRKMSGVQIFLPRIRFKRARLKRTAWVTEALFPGYLFARFDWAASSRKVNYARGVRGIVHFGDDCPTIADNIIQDLQQAVGTSDLHTISPEFLPGDAVQVADGTLRGLHAVVSRVMPGRERVAVLMELLGQQTMIELTASSIVKDGNARMAVFQGETIARRANER
jgi:transcriptional antiterminator RfaH